MGLITVEASTLLRDVFGFPQTGVIVYTGADMLARPDDVTALDWLEERHGIRWWRSTRGKYGYEAPEGYGRSNSAVNASALILQIVGDMKQHAPAAGTDTDGGA